MIQSCTCDPGPEGQHQWYCRNPDAASADDAVTAAAKVYADWVNSPRSLPPEPDEINLARRMVKAAEPYIVNHRVTTTARAIADAERDRIRQALAPIAERYKDAGVFARCVLNDVRDLLTDPERTRHAEGD